MHNFLATVGFAVYESVCCMDKPDYEFIEGMLKSDVLDNVEE